MISRPSISTQIYETLGIVVRNSIILVEFIRDKRNEVVPLRDARTESATARTRSIFLTVAAGVSSSLVIAADLE